MNKEITTFFNRFLATGDNYQSLGFAFRIGRSTVQTIIPEVCNVLWTALSPIYLPALSMEDWQRKAQEFETEWNFPNCCGAIDGKHIALQAPRLTGTKYFCYKKFFSIVLLGISDAFYKFSYVDIGAYGSQSDGGVYKNSMFGRAMERGEIQFPPPRALVEGN